MKPRAADYQKERGYRQERRILAALVLGPKSTAQLQAELSMSRATVGIYIRRLVAEPRRVRIGDYAAPPKGGQPAPLFVLGSGQHARKPKAMSRREVFKRLKADTDRHERFLAKRRLLVRIKNAIRTPTTWLSALGAP